MACYPSLAALLLALVLAVASGDIETDADHTCAKGDVSEYLTPLSDKKVKAPGSCALIGSGAILQGKGHGKDIDAHDTVIRVNRLPTSDVSSDLGIKTSILFINAGYFFGKFGAHVMNVGDKHDDDGHTCPWRYPGHETSGCDFDAMVFDALWDESEYTDKLKFLHMMHAQPFYPLARQKSAFMTVMPSLKPLRYKGHQFIISGGLKAFLTFAPLCESIDLYGFGGTTNLDDHEINPKHNFTLEHLWFYSLERGELIDYDFEVKNTSAIGLDDARNFASMLRHNLNCLVANRKINIVDGPKYEESQGLPTGLIWAALVFACAATVVGALLFRSHRARDAAVNSREAAELLPTSA